MRRKIDERVQCDYGVDEQVRRGANKRWRGGKE